MTCVCVRTTAAVRIHHLGGHHDASRGDLLSLAIAAGSKKKIKKIAVVIKSSQAAARVRFHYYARVACIIYNNNITTGVYTYFFTVRVLKSTVRVGRPPNIIILISPNGIIIILFLLL